MKECFQLNVRVALFSQALQVIARAGISAEKRNNFIRTWNIILKEIDNEWSELDNSELRYQQPNNH